MAQSAHLPSVDAYIQQAAPFAQPILLHLRKLIHEACPDVEEAIKWGCPHFAYQGIFCMMAAFKQHVAFGFSKYQLLHDPHGYLQPKAAHGGHAMGNLGKIRSLADLPPDEVLIDFIRQAVQLNAWQQSLRAKKK